jgi:hypothetical protein
MRLTETIATSAINGLESYACPICKGRLLE